MCNRVICSRNYGAKAIGFGVGARAAMLQGVSEVAEAVKVTMGPKVSDLCSLIFPLFVVSRVCRRFIRVSNNKGKNLFFFGHVYV